MALLRYTEFTGTYTHPASGLLYEYAVKCRVVVDTQGRESMHLRGRVERGTASTGFVVLGHVDPTTSFLGREQQVVLDCVGVTSVRLSDWSLPPTRPGARQDGPHRMGFGRIRVNPLSW